MPTDCDFSETRTSVTLTFYIPPHGSADPAVELADPRTLCYGGERLVLGRAVHSPRVERLGRRVEVTLEKEASGKWYSLGAESGRVAVAETGAEQEDEEAQDLMGLLSKIYSSGNDDVRRAMNKSLYESGGTVLSTDWDEVSKKRVEPEDKP